MTQLTSYDVAKEFFSKARKPTAGRPLGVTGVRLFAHNDSFAINYFALPFALIQPDNTLRFAIGNPPAGVVSGAVKVLPLTIVRRDKAHYRVHVRAKGNPRDYLSSYGLAHHSELRSKGLRLYDGLTIDLATRQPVGYHEPVMQVDSDKRKEWLRKSAALKKHLKTVAKLGGFDAIIAGLRSGNLARWGYSSMRSADGAQLAAFVDALNGVGLDAFTQLVGEGMYREHYYDPNIEEQLAYIDSIFTSNSLALRKALGVVEEV